MNSQEMTAQEKRDLAFYRTQEGIRWIHMSDHDNEYYERLLQKEKWNGSCQEDSNEESN